MLNLLYNLLIGDVNELCYRNGLACFPDHSAILDVGIGNGAMLERHHALIRSKDLRITGIDTNGRYLSHCRKLIRRHRIGDRVDVRHVSVESYRPPPGSRFDFVFFSMSFMLFADQAFVLERVKPWLKPGGCVLFFQTIFRDPSPLLEIVKPHLKYVTTVDFGKVTYERDFFRLLEERGLAIREDRLLKRKWFRGEYRLIAAAPAAGDAKAGGGGTAPRTP
jgi:alpha-N-acetylglucosaminidase